MKTLSLPLLGDVFRLSVVMLLSAHSAFPATITAVSFCPVTAEGSVNGPFVWDAVGGNFCWNIFFSSHTPDAPLLNGPFDAGATPSILLRGGTNVLYFFCEPPPGVLPNWLYAGMSLHFDGNLLPDISVKAPWFRGFDGVDPYPAFSANSFTNTLSGFCSGAQGSGKLSYTNSTEELTLVEWVVGNLGIQWSDRVSPKDAIPNGIADIFGRVVLYLLPKANMIFLRPSEMEISWQSVTNVSYVVLFRSSLTSNIWTPLGNPIEGHWE